MAGAVFLWWGCEQLPLEGALNYAIRAMTLAGYLGVMWRLERSALRRA
jgi:hypothetical protein